MSKDDENRGMNDFAVTKCNIISSAGKHLDKLVDNPWNGITLNESIGLQAGDPQFISGEIFLNDEIDIFNEMSLVGDEVVDLKFKTPGKKGIDFQGRVYSTGYYRSPDGASTGLSIKFCSPEKISSDQIKVNRSYRNVPYSEIIKDLFVPLNDISKKTIYVEPTKNIGSLVVNNESPIDAINKVVQVSRSTGYNGANYVFFESVDGVFRCRSLEGMVDPSKVEPVLTYTFEHTMGEKNDIRKLAAITSFRVIKFPNIISDVQGGMYGSTVVSNDLMKRKVTYNNFDYLDSYDKYKSINFNEISVGDQSKTALTNNDKFRSSSLVHFIPRNYKSFDTEINFNDDRSDLSLVRRSQMQQMNAIQVQVTVSGDSQRKAGEVVGLRLPSTKREDGELDQLLSGRYLISKVKHVISSNVSKGYSTVMLLVKDSYGKPLPKRVG
jgi:hypothetical protein